MTRNMMRIKRRIKMSVVIGFVLQCKTCFKVRVGKAKPWPGASTPTRRKWPSAPPHTAVIHSRNTVSITCLNAQPNFRIHQWCAFLSLLNALMTTTNTSVEKIRWKLLSMKAVPYFIPLVLIISWTKPSSGLYEKNWNPFKIWLLDR